MIDVFEIMDYVYMDGVKFNPFWNEDCYYARLILWLKTPGGSVEDGFVCYRDIIVSGPEMAVAKSSDFLTVRELNKREEEAKEDIFTVCLPYIIDGCTEIASNPGGPWTNLMPGES